MLFLGMSNLLDVLKDLLSFQFDVEYEPTMRFALALVALVATIPRQRIEDFVAHLIWTRHVDLHTILADATEFFDVRCCLGIELVEIRDALHHVGDFEKMKMILSSFGQSGVFVQV